jgi:dienelactone hydrolase
MLEITKKNITYERIFILKIFMIGVILMTVANINAKIKTEIVEYKHGDTILEGYLAYDDSLKGKRPGVIIIHQWGGLKDYEKSRAEQIAALEYVAFAIDMYGKGVRPATPQESAKQATIYRSDRHLMRERAIAGFEELKKHSNVDVSKISAMGYCFGGGTALELARSGADLIGTVSFHGNLDTQNSSDAKNIKGRILVLTGADDPSVPPPQVIAFQDEMRKAGVDWQLVSYGGAVHAFTDPSAGNDNSKGAAYNKKADERSWEEMKRFFKEVFGE